MVWLTSMRYRGCSSMCKHLGQPTCHADVKSSALQSLTSVMKSTIVRFMCITSKVHVSTNYHGAQTC